MVAFVEFQEGLRVGMIRVKFVREMGVQKEGFLDWDCAWKCVTARQRMVVRKYLD